MVGWGQRDLPRAPGRIDRTLLASELGNLPIGMHTCIWFRGSPNLNSEEVQAFSAWSWSFYLGVHGTATFPC